MAIPKIRIVLHDGCLKQVWRWNGYTERHTRRKRRPVHLADKPEVCSWVIPCADHRNKPAGYKPPKASEV